MKTMNFRKMMVLFAVLLFAGITFQSCNKNKPLTQTELEGYWVLKTMNGQDAKNLFAGALPTLQFNFEDHTISGTGGCNRYHGAYSYENGIFSAPNLAMTRMLCIENNAESEFALELSNAANVLKMENGLLVVTRDGKSILEFEQGEIASENKTGINPEHLAGMWVLKSIENESAAEKFKGEGVSIPSIVFDIKENRVSGKSGCNTYNAGFTLNDYELIISPLMSTRMACPDMQGEARFTQMIADTSEVTIINNNVLLLAKNGIVLLEFEKSLDDAATIE